MRRPLLSRLLVAAAAFGLLLAGCEKDKKTQPSTNLIPDVEITGGAAEGQADDYKVEFYWFGYDPDGEIDHFELSVDDMIFAPQDTTTQFSRSVRFAADSLTAGGSGTTVSGNFHRWHRFYVRAVDDRGAVSEPDRRTFNAFTIAPQTQFRLPEGSDVNQFAETVRFKWTGQDDDSSAPDRKPVGYRYKFVHVNDQLQDWGEDWDKGGPGAIQDSLGRLNDDGTVIPSRANINWAWPDSVLRSPAISDSIRKEWIQTRPSTRRGYIQCWLPVMLTDLGEGVPPAWEWKDIPGDLEQIRFEDLANRGFAFAVRAVDEAGAVEPDYVRYLDKDNSGNVYVFEAAPGVPSRPVVTVYESTLGRFRCPTQGNSIEWEVAANKELRFGWEADANSYGGEIQGFNYGLDIPDPSSEMQSDNGIGGWIGWGMWTGNITPIVFPASDDGIVHNLYVKARDTRGETQTALIKLKVVAFPFDKEILIIDDFANYVGVSDPEHDQFVDRILRKRFVYADSSQISWTYGPDLATVQVEPPPPPTLAFLSRYQLVIIYHQESGSNPGDFSVVGNLTSADNPTNARHNPKRRALATYLSAGGKVWVWGIAMSGGLQGDNYTYPKEPENIAGQETPNPETFDSESFLWSMLQIRRGVIELNFDVISNNVMFGAEAHPKAVGQDFPPVLEIDRTRFQNPEKGINQAEAIRGAPLIVAGLDTLYTYKAKRSSSFFDGKPTALYYHSPTGIQGDIAYFGFYYYYFKEDQVTAMCDRVFDRFFTGH